MKDEILSYRDMCNKIQINSIQKGMNFHIKHNLSVILMSIRSGAPYNDEMDYEQNLLIYEGHDVSKSTQFPSPKKINQPVRNENGTLTENGKFVTSIENYKKGLSSPEKILVFEKLRSGIWSEKGLFILVDYYLKEVGGRRVYKFVLQPIEEEIKIFENKSDIEPSRLIPTNIKVGVWKRDKWKCVLCGSIKNLHYDHDLPFSKGGSSITKENVRILCAKCNLKKHDKIE